MLKQLVEAIRAQLENKRLGPSPLTPEKIAWAREGLAKMRKDQGYDPDEKPKTTFPTRKQKQLSNMFKDMLALKAAGRSYDKEG